MVKVDSLDRSPSLASTASSGTTSPPFPRTPDLVQVPAADSVQARISRLHSRTNSVSSTYVSRKDSCSSVRSYGSPTKAATPTKPDISTPDDLTAAIDRILSTGRSTPRSRTYSAQDATPPRSLAETGSVPTTPRRETRFQSMSSPHKSNLISPKFSPRIQDTLRERTNDPQASFAKPHTGSPSPLVTRHGLDRLSEHSEYEPVPDSPTSFHAPSPRSTPSMRSFRSPAYSPELTFKSPTLDAELEKHIPGATTGTVETHRGRGATGRVVLSRKPTVSSSGYVLPSNSIRAMDTSRQHMAAYEYLLHVAEAQAWLDRELQRDANYDASAPEANLTSHGVTQFEQALRNGVALAKLARVFEGREAVPRIYTHPKLAYAHTDNINYFFHFCRRRGLPETYLFETTDLYNARNIPKVIYCIHALNIYLASKGQAQRIKPVENLQFSEDQLAATKKGIDHLVMPNFKSLGKEVAQDLDLPPPEPRETEEERMARLRDEAMEQLAGFPAHVQGVLARRAFKTMKRERAEVGDIATLLQARARGALARRTHHSLTSQLHSYRFSPVSLQAQVRRHLAQKRLQSTMHTTQLQTQRIVPVQAQIRGLLARRQFWKPIQSLDTHEVAMTRFQGHIRGLLTRKQHSHQVQQVTDLSSSSTLPRFQAAARRVLAEKALLEKIQIFKSQTPVISKLQAAARGRLARQKRRDAHVQLAQLPVEQGVCNLQTLARALLTRRALRQQTKELEVRQPDVTAFQAVARQKIAARYYNAWLAHLHANEHIAIFLQCFLRGALARRQYYRKLVHYQEHMDKVVKVQSVFRRKQQAQQYNELTRGRNVPISTVKNFLHLLQDSDYDYAEELEVEHLRKNVIQYIRDNQVIEAECNELDTKIALLVQTKMSLDEVLATRRNGVSMRNGNQQAVLAANNDPFSSKSLDRHTQHRLELYQEMFYLLQTDPDYLARLFHVMPSADAKHRKDMERIVMTLFGYAQQSREEFLLLKLVQRSLHEEIMTGSTLEKFVTSDFLFFKLMMQYGRSGKGGKYLRETLSVAIQAVDEDVDLEADPVAIYKKLCADEEAATGIASKRPRDVNARQALGDQTVLKIIIDRLIQTRTLAHSIFTAMTTSTNKMPFGVRWLAREMYRALRAAFRSESQDACLAAVAEFIQHRYITPVIVAPDNFGIIDGVLSTTQRQALSAVANLLDQVSTGTTYNRDEDPTLNSFNDYITRSHSAYQDWISQIIDVPDAEEALHADVYSEHTAKRPVIYISPNEIYEVHSLLMTHSAACVPSDSDRMQQILAELGAPPKHATDELNRARSGEVELQLLSKLEPTPSASTHVEAMWTSTKRLILLILKVQPGDNLKHALEMPVTREQERIWQQICTAEIKGKHRVSRATSIRVDEVYRLTFAQLKEQALVNLVELQSVGRLGEGEDETYQEMLNAIARDIRQKHRIRMQRHTELSNMQHTLSELEGKRKYLDSKLESYHEYLKQTQATMHKKGKKRLTIPFTTQFFHERSLAKKGLQPKFGSYVYSAARLYEDRILLSIDQMSTSRFDQIKVIISCDSVGVFDVETQYSGVKVTSAKVQYSDLLEAQYNGQKTYTIEDMAKFNINQLLILLHKKFFA